MYQVTVAEVTDSLVLTRQRHVRPKMILQRAIAYTPSVNLQLLWQTPQSLGPYQYLAYPRSLPVLSWIFYTTMTRVSRIALSSAKNVPAARYHVFGELHLHPWNVVAFVNLITHPSAIINVVPYIHCLAID
jgi:hypothetical protein